MCQVHVSLHERIIPPECGELNDTFEACQGSRTSCFIYAHGGMEPHFPVPAVVHQVIYPWMTEGFLDMIYINDEGSEDDPYIVGCWDFEPGPWYGKHQHCYTDVRAQWYKDNNAWRV